MAPEMKISRPYRERFLDGFDRSQLRQEVEKVKRRRFHKVRRRYVSLALGASLAMVGIGAPLKVIHDSHERVEYGGQRAPEREVAATTGGAVDQAITNDLKAAQNIANQVAGGVAAAAKSVQQAAKAPFAAVAQVPAEIAQVTEDAKAQFFAKNIPFGSIIYNEAKKNSLRPELVAAIVQQESRFKPTARSHMGAQGLMQLVPKTGRWMGATNLMNPAQNIMAGTKYLKYLHEQFNGNETKIIAAYNAGEGNVRRFGGVPPFRETQKYVANVRNFQRDYSDRAESHTADAAPATQVADMR